MSSRKPEEISMMNSTKTMLTDFPAVMAIENCTELFGNVTVAQMVHNVTCLGHAPTLTHQALIRAIVLAIMSLLSLVGNLATILAISRDANRTSLCTMILHLSVADIFVSLFCLAGESIWTYTVAWTAGNIMCKTVKYWQMFGLYLSTYLVVVIGIDRWIAISKPLKRNKSGRSWARIWTLTAWILSALFSLPQLLIFRVSKGPFVEDFYQCVTYGSYTAKWQEQLYSILSLLLMFVIPLIILIVTYTSAILKLKQSERTLDLSATSSRLINNAESKRQKRMRKATKRSLQMSLFIVGGFLLCWIPYYLLYISLLFGLAPEEYGQTLIQNIFFFGMSNSLINPLIYGAFHLWRPTAAHSTCPPGQSSRGTVTNQVYKNVNGNHSPSVMSFPMRSLQRSVTLASSTTVQMESQRLDTDRPRSRQSSSPMTISATTGSATMTSKPPVTRCNTTDVHNNGKSRETRVDKAHVPMARHATFDCTEEVDRKRASMKRRAIMKERLRERKHLADLPDFKFDYSQEILGETQDSSRDLLVSGSNSA